MTDPLYWLPAELEPVAFRLARADECAYEIGDTISNWSQNDPVQVYQLLKDGRVKTCVDSVRPVPPNVSLLFSEAINHIRASIDNVVWYMVEKEEGQLSPDQERSVAFPITLNEKKFDSWCNDRVRKELNIFQPDGVFAGRLKSLQPWNDETSVVPSISKRLAALQQVSVENAGALALLQAYSNWDKHRSVRMALARSSFTTSDMPILDQDLSFQDFTPGMMLHEVDYGSPTVLEMHPAILVSRPSPFEAGVNPVKEINNLRKYAAEIAIPTLVRGMAITAGLPPRVDFSDSGLSRRERLDKAEWSDATERLKPALMARFASAMKAELSVPEIREESKNDE